MFPLGSTIIIIVCLLKVLNRSCKESMINIDTQKKKICMYTTSDIGFLGYGIHCDVNFLI